ncbi:hypothetical protein PMAYCL1PPCAC_22284, partial [Pristionchus mayeri]
MYLISTKILAVLTLIEHVNVGTGILSNLVLLYLIVKFSRENMGTYKYLLITFASYDIFLTIVHALCNQQIVIVNITTFAAYVTCLFCASYSIPFTLILIHFLYRYWAIQNPDRIVLFTRKPFIALLVAFCGTVYMIWFCLVFFGFTGAPGDESVRLARAEYFRRYGRDIKHGWVVGEHWKDGKFNLRPALVLLALDSILIFLIILATVICVITLNHIAKTEAFSAYTKVLHTKLLQTLVVQTMTPVLLVYTPYILKLTLPFLGIPEYGSMAACTALNSAFPTFDAVIIGTMINDYR